MARGEMARGEWCAELAVAARRACWPDARRLDEYRHGVGTAAHAAGLSIECSARPAPGALPRPAASALVPASRSLRPELVAPSPFGVPFRVPSWSATPGAVCPSTAAEAHAWLDGELAPRAAAGFGAHLAACAPCRAHVAALGRFLAALRRPAARPPAAPASLRLRVRDLVARWHAQDHAPDAALPAAPTPDARSVGVGAATGR